MIPMFGFSDPESIQPFAGQLLPGALYTICLDKDGLGATHIFQAYGSWVKNLGESGGIYHDIYIITIILYIYTLYIYIHHLVI